MQGKLKCLIFKMLIIRIKRPKLIEKLNIFEFSHLDLFYCPQGVSYRFANQKLRVYISRLSCIFIDNDDMESTSSKRVIFILKCLPKSSVIIVIIIIILCNDQCEKSHCDWWSGVCDKSIDARLTSSIGVTGTRDQSLESN